MKRIAAIPAIIFIIILAAIPITARSAGNGRLYIRDSAELLTAAQRDELEERAAQITKKYECDVRIVTLDSIGELIPMHASNSFYYEHDFGFGPDRSCALLLLSMEGRDYDLAVWGFAKTAFTEYGKDTILDKHILPLLKVNDFHGAFSAFLDKTEVYLALAKEGTPFTADTDPHYVSKNYLINLIARLGIAILLPLLISAHICFYWVKKMRTAGIAQTAHHYVPAYGFNLTGQQDTFLYRTVSSTKIESSGGGSRSSGSSSGGSHRSGKF